MFLSEPVLFHIIISAKPHVIPPSKICSDINFFTKVLMKTFFADIADLASNINFLPLAVLKIIETGVLIFTKY